MVKKSQSKSSPSRIIYWDACVFISMVEGHSQRLPIIQSVLDEMDKGETAIHTSELCIAEVAFAKVEKDGKALDPETEKKIDALWQDPAAFRLSEISSLILYEAKSLIRTALESGFSLKAGDAIHIATARHVNASEFHTYDQGLTKYEPVFKLKFCAPYPIHPNLFTSKDSEHQANEDTND